MSDHDPFVVMRHMMDAAREAISFAAGKTREDLDADRMLELTLVRLVEVVGEAASRVAGEERERYPTVPWKTIVATRNRLIHGYDQVDLDILWNIVSSDLPALVNLLGDIIPKN
jgi:uncharacterized protein with HEPN domain